MAIARNLIAAGSVVPRRQTGSISRHEPLVRALLWRSCGVENRGIPRPLGFFRVFRALLLCSGTMSQVVVERHIDLKSERAALWCAVGDTERLNRAIGLGRLELKPNSDASAARFVVRTVSAGMPLEYE